MTDTHRFGPYIVLTIAIAAIVWRSRLLIIPFLAGTLGRQHIAEIARLVLTIGLMYCLWRGQSWARWATVVLVCVWGLLGGWSLRGHFSSSAHSELAIHGLIVAFWFAAGGLLAFSPSVGRFLMARSIRNRDRWPALMVLRKSPLMKRVKFVVFALTPVTSLIVVPELVCRVYELDRPQFRAPMLIAGVAGLVRDDEELFWTLRPNLQVEYRSHRVSTNSLGFRCPEVGRKQPNEIRILSLGESTTFGDGVGDEDTYSAHLEDALSQLHPNHSFRVINAGVPAYSSFQSVKFLETRGVALEPDLVLFYHEYNDSLRTILREGGDKNELGLALSDKGLYQSRTNRWHREWIRCSATYRFITYFLARRRVEQPSEYADQVTRHRPDYRHGRKVQTRLPIRVPPEQRIENLQQLRSICHDHAVALLIIHPVYRDTVRHDCELTRFCIEENVAMFEAFDALHSNEEDLSSLFLDSMHPNARGHELLARGLTRFLIDAGAVKQRTQNDTGVDCEK